MTQAHALAPLRPRPPRMPPYPQHSCKADVARLDESNRTEAELCKIWSQVCAVLEEHAPVSALPTPDVTMVSGDAKRCLRASTPHSLESTAVASARTTGTKSSPWSLASGMARADWPLASEFPEASSRQGDFQTTPDLIGSDEGDFSPSFDTAKLRLKLEKLAGHSMRHPLRDAYAQGSSRMTSKSRAGDISSRSMGTGIHTPLSVHSVSAPPHPVSTPQQPSPSQLPWLQLSGSQLSMPSFRALQACADMAERPGTASSVGSSVGLPPLPGAIPDTIVAPHTLRNLARSSQIRNRCDLDIVRHDRPDAEHGSGRSDVQPLNKAKNAGSSITHLWRAPRERKRDISRHFNPRLPRKRSRLKRMLFRLWRFGRSKGT